MNQSFFLLASASVLAGTAWSQNSSQGTTGTPPVAPELSQETLTEGATYSFPLTQQKVHVQKTFSLETGQFGLSYTDELGQPVNLQAVRAAEAAARQASPQAKIEPALLAALADGSTELHEVVIWLRFDTDPIDTLRQEIESSVDIESLIPEEVEPIEAQIGEYARELVQANNQPVGERLRALGAKVRLVSGAFPVISITAPAEMIETIASWDEVDTLYAEGEAEDLMDVANAAHYTNYLTNAGFDGSGIRCAVLENNGVDPAHPNLSVTQWFNPLSPNPDTHVQGTAGCIASTRPDRIGSAAGVSLYSANAATYSMTDITAAAEWVTTRNVDLTNNSWGYTTSSSLYDYFSRMFDYQSRVYQDSYIAASGNEGATSTVRSPGAAWNVITAGSFNDSGTASWGDDSMSSFSSAGDPSNQCMKPNVTASGSCIDTLGLAPTWIRDCYSGTSFASPFVTGTVTHLMKADGTARWAPEAAMAGVMASAWHNVEGATRLSDLDGAGAVHTLAAHNMGQDNRVRAVTLTPSSFNSFNEYRIPVKIRRGRRTRVCIAWSARGTSDYSSTSLDADLELIVDLPSSMISITASLSTFNNYEIVDFTAPLDGIYNIVIRNSQFNGASERVGIAWSFWDDQCEIPGGLFLCEAPGTPPTPDKEPTPRRIESLWVGPASANREFTA